MKILITANVRWWNAEASYAWEKALGLLTLGHQVIFLVSPGSQILEKASACRIPTYVTAGLNSLNPLKWPGTVPRLRAYLRAEKFDVIDAHRSEGLVLLALAVRGTGAALMRTRGDMRAPRRDPVNRLIHLRWCAGLSASGNVVAERMATALGCSRSRIEVIYYGVNARYFSPGDGYALREEWGLKPEHFLVGFIGRVSRVKGLANFLQAASVTVQSHPQTRFLIAVKEDHPDLGTYREMMGKMGLSGMVTFLGHRADINRVYQALDVVAVASLASEANGRVTVEAMACGRPVVATLTGVLPEVVQNGKTGFLVEAGKAAPLAEALRMLADSPDLAREMGRSSRKLVEAKYTRQVMAERTEKFYLRSLQSLKIRSGVKHQVSPGR